MEFLTDEYFMRAALRQAAQAAEAGEVPIGAVAVQEHVIIARSGNMVEQLKDATAHAEMLVITQAANTIGDWRLDNVTIYVTKEPCAMCAGAMVNSHVKRVVFALADNKYGACGGALNICDLPGALWKVETTAGVLQEESKNLIQEFFSKVRERKK